MSYTMFSVRMKFEILGFFENLSQKIKVRLQSDKNNEYFTWRPM
jgi:hypothetical protein